MSLLIAFGSGAWFAVRIILVGTLYALSVFFNLLKVLV